MGKKKVVGWALSVTWEDEEGQETEESIVDLPSWVSNVVDDYLTEVELEIAKEGANYQGGVVKDYRTRLSDRDRRIVEEYEQQCGECGYGVMMKISHITEDGEVIVTCPKCGDSETNEELEFEFVNNNEPIIEGK